MLLRFRDPYGRYGYEDTHDEHFERLKRELHDALSTIIEVMPEEIRKVLESYYRCESPDDAKMWESTARWKIIELAKPIPDQQLYGYNLTDRVPDLSTFREKPPEDLKINDRRLEAPSANLES